MAEENQKVNEEVEKVIEDRLDNPGHCCLIKWHVSGVSVQGTWKSKPCQDAHDYRVLDDCLVIALADGAGSVPFSEEGAQRATKVACDKMVDMLTAKVPSKKRAWKKLMRSVFAHAREALMEQAGDRDLRDLATTLACVVATPSRLVVAQLGDGLVVARSTTETLFVAVEPQRGEYANSTYFLTGDRAMKQVEVQFYEPVQALVAITDGLLNLAVENPGCVPYAPFFHPLISFVEREGASKETDNELADFLCSDQVCQRTDDDKTLVVAVRGQR